MARLAAIALVLGMCMPETLLAWVTFETGEIDSSTVRPGASVEVIYGRGERNPVSGEWERLDTARGYIQAIDAETLTIGERYWKKVIALERIQKLIIATSAQDEKRKPSFELGAELLSVEFQSDQYASRRRTNLGGGLVRTSPSIYLSGFFLNELALDLGLGLTAWSYDGGSHTSWVGRGGLTYFYILQGAASNSVYVRSFVATLDGDSSDTQYGAGGGLGYRHVFQDRIAMRLETSYLRWFRAEEDHITVRLSFGGILGAKSPAP